MAVTHTRQLIQWNHGLRREALVERLLGDILDGTFARGQRLVAQDLANRYRVSQTPIREALITLAGVGIVDLLPNRGAIVRTITRQDVLEVCQVRRVLECEAVRTASENVPPHEWQPVLDDIRNLQVAIRKPTAHTIAVAQKLDDALHERIAAGSGNILLGRELARLRILFKAYRDASWERVAKLRDYSRLIHEADEHVAIVDALVRGDANAAAAAMAHHIHAGQQYWTAAVFSSDNLNSTD